MKNKTIEEALSKILLSEAVQKTDLDKVSSLTVKYFTKKLGKPVVRMPGYEKFKSKYGIGIGIRFFYGLNCFRLNWNSTRPNSAFLSSVDVWVSGRSVADHHIEFKEGESLVKSFPVIIDVLQGKLSDGQFTYIEEVTNWQIGSPISEEFLFEAGNAKMIYLADVEKILSLIKPGVKTGPIISTYKSVGYKIINAIKTLYPNALRKEGVAYVSVVDGVSLNAERIYDAVGGKAVIISKGDPSEKPLPTTTEKDIEDNAERVVFEEQLKDLKSITQLVIKGAAFSMFVAGRGGIGKTHTVEETLSAAGLRDGSGYQKITGTASPVAIYRTLYDNKDGIILFDDCDGALADQDARNIIKAATDTKKIRKLAYLKKASWLYNPDFDEEGEREDDGENYPSYFYFTGKIIFISNLKMSKLDPDGALRTRSFVVNIDPTDMEVVDFMKKIAGTVPLEDGLTLTKEERESTVNVIAKTTSGTELNLRKLVRALNIRASGVDNWENLVKRYA